MMVAHPLTHHAACPETCWTILQAWITQLGAPDSSWVVESAGSKVGYGRKHQLQPRSLTEAFDSCPRKSASSTGAVRRRCCTSRIQHIDLSGETRSHRSLQTATQSVNLINQLGSSYEDCSPNT
eukprot:6465429-Amphidinium_carterae.2